MGLRALPVAAAGVLVGWGVGHWAAPQVLAALSGSSLARVIPEVIVCVLELGDARDAYELLHRIQTMAAGRGREIPIVALARDRDVTPMNEVLEAGFAGYIKTPVDPEQLCELLAEVADARRRDRGGAE